MNIVQIPVEYLYICATAVFWDADGEMEGWTDTESLTKRDRS